MKNILTGVRPNTTFFPIVKYLSNKMYVPSYKEPQHMDLLSLFNFIKSKSKLLVLTGAGISTESGIPDYRSDITGRYIRHKPIQYGTFIKDSEARKHFWARNYAAWTTYVKFEPNVNHRIIQKWELHGLVYWLVTQNVDMLHSLAGSVRLTELHGSARTVVCMSCNNAVPRDLFQETLRSYNPTWDHTSVDIQPDGDINVPQKLTGAFQVPACSVCNGLLKPDIVFFGDSVPRDRVAFIFEKVNECDGMLILGSSLQVQSAYRFVRAAAHAHKPIAIVNIGDTRADHLAKIKLSTMCSTVLREVDALLMRHDSAVM